MPCTFTPNKSAVLSDFPTNTLLIEADGDSACINEDVTAQFKVTNTNSKRNITILTATARLFDVTGVDRGITLAPEFLPSKTISCNGGCILIRFTIQASDWVDGDFVKLLSLTFNSDICEEDSFKCPS